MCLEPLIQLSAKVKSCRPQSVRGALRGNAKRQINIIFLTHPSIKITSTPNSIGCTLHQQIISYSTIQIKFLLEGSRGNGMAEEKSVLRKWNISYTVNKYDRQCYVPFFAQFLIGTCDFFRIQLQKFPKSFKSPFKAT